MYRWVTILVWRLNVKISKRCVERWESRARQEHGHIEELKRDLHSYKQGGVSLYNSIIQELQTEILIAEGLMAQYAQNAGAATVRYNEAIRALQKWGALDG